MRETLDLQEQGDIRHGLQTGLINKRGATSRAYHEGGGLERNFG